MSDKISTVKNIINKINCLGAPSFGTARHNIDLHKINNYKELYNLSDRVTKEFLLYSNGSNVWFMNIKKLSVKEKILAISNTHGDGEKHLEELFNMYYAMNPGNKSKKLLKAFIHQTTHEDFPIFEYMNKYNMLQDLTEEFFYAILCSFDSAFLLYPNSVITNVDIFKKILKLHPEFGNGLLIRHNQSKKKNYKWAVNIAQNILQKCNISVDDVDNIVFVMDTFFGKYDISKDLLHHLKNDYTTSLHILTYLLERYPNALKATIKKNVFGFDVPSIYSRQKEIFSFVTDKDVYNSLQYLYKNTIRDDLYCGNLMDIKLDGSYNITKILRKLIDIYDNVHKECSVNCINTFVKHTLIFIMNNIDIINEKASADTLLLLSLKLEL